MRSEPQETPDWYEGDPYCKEDEDGDEYDPREDEPDPTERDDYEERLSMSENDRENRADRMRSYD